MFQSLLLVCVSGFGVPAILAGADCRDPIALSFAAEREGRYLEAKSILTAALAEARVHPGNPEGSGKLLLRLGWVCYVLGEYDEARIRYRAAVVQLAKALGGAHPVVASAMSGYAAVCEARRELKEAERVRLQALEILEHELGVRHPNTLTMRSDLARGYFQRREYERAETAFREVLASWPTEASAGDARLGQTWTGLGYVFLETRRSREARDAFERSLLITSKIAGAGHPIHIDATFGLASAQLAEGQLSQAEQNLMQLQAQAESVLGQSHPLSLQIMEARGRALQSLGHRNEARALQKSARTLRAKAAESRPSVSWAEIAK